MTAADDDGRAGGGDGPAPAQSLRLAAVPLLLAFLASLPFHRPTVTAALGPALALPELLFLPLAPVLALALAAGKAGRKAGRKAGPSMSRTGVLLALVLVVGLAPSVLLAGDRRRALVQLAVLVYVALIHQVALAARALGLRRPALMALVAGAALACALGLAATAVAWGGGHAFHLAVSYPWMPIARPLGPTESPNMLAMVALAGTAAALALARDRALPRWLTAVLLVIFVLTLVLSQSRVLLAAAVGLGVTLLCRPPAALGGTLARAAAALLIGGAALLLALSLWFRVVPLGPAPPFIDTTIGPYRVCHEIALSMARAHPLTGVGLENFHRAWPDHYDPARHDAAYRGGAEALRGRALDPHGTVQGYLAEGGLPGLAAVLLIAALIWRRRGQSPETLGFLVALGCALLFTDLLTERSTLATLGLLLGPTLGYQRTPRP